MTDNDILRFRSRKPVPRPSVHVGSSSTFDLKSVKEVIEFPLFQMDQKQEIMSRRRDMKAALSRQIARNRQLKDQL